MNQTGSPSLSVAEVFPNFSVHKKVHPNRPAASHLISMSTPVAPGSVRVFSNSSEFSAMKSFCILDIWAMTLARRLAAMAAFFLRSDCVRKSAHFARLSSWSLEDGSSDSCKASPYFCGCGYIQCQCLLSILNSTKKLIIRGWLVWHLQGLSIFLWMWIHSMTKVYFKFHKKFDH